MNHTEFDATEHMRRVIERHPAESIHVRIIFNVEFAKYFEYM